MCDLALVAELETLRFLDLYGLPKVAELPSCARLLNLEHARIGQLRGLAALHGLLQAPNLRELELVRKINVSENDVNGIISHPAIEAFSWFAEDVPDKVWVPVLEKQVTQEWWNTRSADYELCVSQLVLDEAGAGDAQAAQERLLVLRPMLVLETAAEALELAKELLQAGGIAGESNQRRASHRGSSDEGCPIPVDLELPPLGRRCDATLDRGSLQREGIQGSDHLYARGIAGGQTMNDPIVDEVRRI